MNLGLSCDTVRLIVFGMVRDRDMASSNSDLHAGGIADEFWVIFLLWGCWIRHHHLRGSGFMWRGDGPQEHSWPDSSCVVLSRLNFHRSGVAIQTPFELERPIDFFVQSLNRNVHTMSSD